MIASQSAADKSTFSVFPENSKLSFLLEGIRQGWHIFPLHLTKFDQAGKPMCSCERKGECGAMAKHPVGRWSEPWSPASPHLPDVVREFLKTWPDRGFGIHLGLSGLVCLDVDPKNGGLESIAELERLGVLPPIDWHVRTGSAGLHAFFAAPVNCDPRKGWRGPNGETRCTVQLAPGMEFHCGQHFMVLAYSPHKSGNTYAALGDIFPTSVPPALVALVDCQPVFAANPRPAPCKPYVCGSTGASADSHAVERARQYIRTIALIRPDHGGSRVTSRLCRVLLVDFGLSRADARVLFDEWNRTLAIPWTDDERERKLDWGEKGAGTRGWRNAPHDVSLTDEERKLVDQLAASMQVFTQDEIHRTIEEIDREQQKEQPDLPSKKNQREPQNQQERPEVAARGDDDENASRRPRCERIRRLLLPHKKTGNVADMYVPCRRLHCAGCFATKKSVWMESVSCNLRTWKREHGGTNCPRLVYAYVCTSDLKKHHKRIIRKGGRYFSVDVTTLGEDPGPFSLIVSTVPLVCCAGLLVSPDEAACLLAKAIDSLPTKVRVKVFWHSQAWPNVDEDKRRCQRCTAVKADCCCDEGFLYETQWGKAHSHHTKTPVVEEIAECYKAEGRPISGGSRYWRWSAIVYKLPKSLQEKFIASVQAGCFLDTEVTFGDEADIPQGLPEPDATGKFSTG